MSGYYIIPAPSDFLNLSGGTVTGATLFSGGLSGSNLFITSALTQNDLLDQVVVYNPVTYQLEFRDAGSIGVLGNFVHISGDTMTGPLTVPELNVTGSAFLSGTSFYFVAPSAITGYYELVNYGLLTGYTYANSSYLTGGTFTGTDLELYQNNGKPTVVVNFSSATFDNLQVTGNTALGDTSVGNLTASTITSGNTPLSQIFPYSATNVGYGQATVFKQKANDLLEFNTFSAGTRIILNQGPSEITISTSGVNQYFIQDYAPSAITPTVLYNGDRWFNTLIGVEFVYMSDGDSSQWVEPLLSFSANTSGNTITGSGTPNRIAKFTSTSTVSDTQTPIVEDGQGIVVGGAARDQSAVFQIESNQCGFLPPRLTESQLNAIGNPAIGLIVYQLDGVEGLYIYKSDNNWHLLG